MEKRMTWDQIRQTYPDQWVKLVDVEWMPDNQATVKTAVVARIGDPTEQDLTDALEEKSCEMYTTPDNHLSMGAVMA